MASAERAGFVENTNHLFKITRNGSIGIAIVGAFFAPEIVIPALVLAGAAHAETVLLSNSKKQ